MTQFPIDPVACLKSLVACPSVTPAEGGALSRLAETLGGLGFATERLVFSEPGTPDVENLFATIGDGGRHLVFAGHTDVVPVGDEARWTHPPFGAEIADGALYGRGAVDMKGGIAAFVAAASGYLAADGPAGTLSLLITGDEEGPAINGTVKLLDWALAKGYRFDAALVGEPTSAARLGDTVKIGRRGSMSGTIRVPGRQGHVAYPHLADNPVPVIVRILHRLSSLTLDEGTDGFQPSNLEITSVDVGNFAFNVIPGEATARFNIRFNDRWSVADLTDFLRAEIAAAADGTIHELDIVQRPSEWFLTRSDALIDPLSTAIRDVTGETPALTTGGGTSDARFFKDVCPVVEFGLVGDTMHQVDERVPIDDLTRLATIYRGFLDRYFASAADA
ncbi:succinyl-diaminopimelate desuccinylase [Bauldia litoralis]|uniref:succinyl-diaminopimelate desuccinylase n=1 Tax=Bauldia litoralis TaxID=665467 RepID=UPI003265E486